MIILGCGYIYYYVSAEKNIPSLCIFLPPLVYFLIGLYSQWVKNDFHVILPSTHRNPPRSHWLPALVECGFPGNDYFMVTGIVIEIGLIVGLGFALSWYITPSWVGPIVSWTLIVLITTVTPMVEYFHTFEFSVNMFVMTGISLASYFIGLILIFTRVLDGQPSESSFMLLLAGFLYPIIILFTVGIARWHDDKWEISDFVVWTNFIGGMLLILMFFSIALVYTPWWIGGGLMLIFVIGLMAIMVLPKLKDLSPAWYKIVSTGSLVLMIAFVVGSTLQDSSGFIGFTVMCGLLLIAMFGVVYYAFRGSPYDEISIHKHKLIVYSEHIFPIYQFDTMAKGKVNPLTEVNHRVWPIYAIFGICYVWGIFALFFLSPTTIGLCVSSLAIAGAAIYTSELMFRASVRNHELAEAIDYMEEGSETYHTILSQCKWIATKNQLLADSTLFISTKENRLAAEMPIQADAHSHLTLDSKAQDAIIDQLEFIHTQQDWRSLRDKYLSLDRSLSHLTCCGRRSSYEFVIDGEVLTRREAFRRLDSLFIASTQCFQRSQMYDINLQQEIIKAVVGRKYDRMTQILAMIREKGNFTITMEYLKSVNQDAMIEILQLWLVSTMAQLDSFLLSSR